MLFTHANTSIVKNINLLFFYSDSPSKEVPTCVFIFHQEKFFLAKYSGKLIVIFQYKNYSLHINIILFLFCILKNYIKKINIHIKNNII